MIQTAIIALLLQAALYPTASVPGSATPYRTLPETGADTAEPSPGESPRAPPPELARTGVLIDSYDKRVESRWGVDDPFYASTVRGGASAAQSRQGRLDGGWTLAETDGAPLYALQLVDTGEGGVEGAWRRIKPGSASASGFIALISPEPARLVLRFLEPGAAAPTVATVNLGADGAWRGDIARTGEPGTPVTLTRR